MRSEMKKVTMEFYLAPRSKEKHFIQHLIQVLDDDEFGWSCVMARYVKNDKVLGEWNL